MTIFSHCQRVLDAADKAIIAHDSFKLVLAGGTAPVKAYQLLATKQADWSKWHIYYGDERCLPIETSLNESCAMIALSAASNTR
jgi:6-phosphogluconolactonase